MKKLRASFLLLVSSLVVSGAAFAVDVDQRDFSQADGFEFTTREDGLTITWDAPEGRAFMDLQFIPRRRNTPAAPLIHAIGIDGVAALEDVDPNYLFWVGDRDLELRDGWEIFFDRVPTRPYSVEKGFLVPGKVTVSTKGGRATVEIDGLSSAHFSGSLAFMLYHGSPFVHMEARVTTDRPATAFLYHVGLGKPDTEGHRIDWVDSFGNSHSTPVLEEKADVYKTRYRSMALSSDTGSLVISPFPHQYLFPLDFAENYGFNWAGNDYLDMIDGFAWGVRQPPMGDRRYVPWVNAPPGTEQKLGVLLFVSRQPGLDNLAVVRRYTHDDSFKPLPGYKTLGSHFHQEHSRDFTTKQSEQNVTGVPAGLENPDFVQFFKRMGVDMVHMAEFHSGSTPRLDTMERLAKLDVMHKEFARLSSPDFLLIPGEEPNVYFGGHWLSLFPNPVNWVLNRNNGQPFEQEIEGYGTVYHVGSAADVLALMQKESGLSWTAHARVKGATGYPDSYRESDFFKSDTYLGAAWKAMPADYSRDSLGWRVLDLEDDMANWGERKYILGEVDIFKMYEDYELFGAMNVNYLKLDAIPAYKSGWQPVLDALRSGQFFVTTGEVLIPEFSISGRESGETLSGPFDRAVVDLTASLEWTYPLSHMNIVSGDGNKIYKERVELADTREFDSRTLQLQTDLRGRTWVRIEVWDIARNGAFTQPVWMDR